jgi:hypothetical protein
MRPIWKAFNLEAVLGLNGNTRGVMLYQAKNTGSFGTVSGISLYLLQQRTEDRCPKAVAIRWVHKICDRLRMQRLIRELLERSEQIDWQANWIVFGNVAIK